MSRKDPHGRHPLLGIPISTPHLSNAGRIAPSSDFGVRQQRREEGVPSLGMAPPNSQTDNNAEDSVEQRRQMFGLAPNQRSNSFVFDPTNPTYQDPNDPTITVPQNIPFFQFNGTTPETDMLTLMFGLQIQSLPLSGIFDLPAFASFPVKALIKWGVGNAFFTVQTDWKQGSMISIPANYLSVNVLIPAAIIAQLPPVTFTAGVAYGAVPAQGSRATLSQSTDLITSGGGSATIPVPPWACSFGIAPSKENFVGPVICEFLPLNTVSGAVIEPDASGRDFRADRFSIPDGTYNLKVFNEDANSNMNFTVIWGYPF